MAVTVRLNDELEAYLRRELRDLDRAATEALLVHAFRQGKLTHYQLAQALGLDRFETDALLKQHNVVEGSPTFEEVEADRRTFERMLGPERG